MNHQNARRIRDQIMIHPNNFDMNYFSLGSDINSLKEIEEGSCGTTMCIAGWARFLDQGRMPDDLDSSSTEKIARDFLEISVRFADWLFYLTEGEGFGPAKLALELMTKEDSTEESVANAVMEAYPELWETYGSARFEDIQHG